MYTFIGWNGGVWCREYTLGGSVHKIIVSLIRRETEDRRCGTIACRTCCTINENGVYYVTLFGMPLLAYLYRLKGRETCLFLHVTYNI